MVHCVVDIITVISWKNLAVHNAFKDDIRRLADLKQQISQKMTLLRSTSPKCCRSMHYLFQSLHVPCHCRVVWQRHFCPVNNTIAAASLWLSPRLLLPFNLPTKICVQILWRPDPNQMFEMLESEASFFTIFRNSLPVHICFSTDAFSVY